MTEEISSNPIVARLDEARRKLGLSREGLSKKAGFDRGYLQKLSERGPDATIRAPSLRRLATAAEINLEDLLTDIVLTPPGTTRPLLPGPIHPAPAGALPARIPIIGSALGGALSQSEIMGEPIGRVDRPPGLADVRDAYAIYVEGGSMEPRHRPGELRFVHPHKPPRTGDDVVVHALGDTGQIQMFIKIFVGYDDQWLVCYQIKGVTVVRFASDRV